MLPLRCAVNPRPLGTAVGTLLHRKNAACALHEFRNIDVSMLDVRLVLD